MGAPFVLLLVMVSAMMRNQKAVKLISEGIRVILRRRVWMKPITYDLLTVVPHTIKIVPLAYVISKSLVSLQVSAYYPDGTAIPTPWPSRPHHISLFDGQNGVAAKCALVKLGLPQVSVSGWNARWRTTGTAVRIHLSKEFILRLHVIRGALNLKWYPTTYAGICLHVSL